MICIPNQIQLLRSPQGERHRRTYNTHGGEDERIHSLLGTPEVKRALGRPNRRYKIHAKKKGWEGFD